MPAPTAAWWQHPPRSSSTSVQRRQMRQVSWTGGGATGVPPWSRPAARALCSMGQRAATTSTPVRDCRAAFLLLL